MNFYIKGSDFYLNDKKIKIISGAVHYFRNMPDTWRDIFKKLRALGCNCVETYCAWNMHEKRPGEFDFSGMLDISRFLTLAQQEGLLAIVRPGPYICAEWEFGGLPWWIQTYDDMEIRCSSPVYMKYFKRYIKNIADIIAPLQITRGGNVIMVQCENEYGYYGDDKNYLKELRDYYVSSGIEVPLFTSDGTGEDNLLDGTVEGCLATLNFGSRAEGNFSAHSKMFPPTTSFSRTVPKCAWRCGTAGLTHGATKSTTPRRRKITQKRWTTCLVRAASICICLSAAPISASLPAPTITKNSRPT